jgi:hypothetical protein
VVTETKEVAGLVERLDKLAEWLDIKSMPGGSGDCRDAAREIERLQSDLTRYIDIATKEATEAEGLRATVSTLTRQLEEAREALPGDDEWQLLLSAVENLRGGSQNEERRVEAAWRIAGNLAKFAERINAIRSLKQGERDA